MELTLPIREVLPATPRAQIVRLDLGDCAFDYAAGQAVMVGTHGVDRRRPYSISAAPEDARRDGAIELLVGTEPSDASETHFVPVAGELADVEGPIGTFIFPPSPEEGRFVFIAGGTGIAPLRAMLRHALAIPHREIGLFYSARTPEEFAYEPELRELARAGEIELRQTITRSVDAQWTGARGRVNRAALEDLVRDPMTLCFVCGPPALVEEVPKLLEDLGVAPDRIKIERR